MVKLRRDATILGREKGDILIKDREISSTHCQIQFIEGVYHIFDMNSTNGTLLMASASSKPA
jgi:pSer/pThr/pTyr-binding forkhead associated (FHA) protein